MSQESLGSGSSLVVRRSAPFSGALRSDEALDWRDATERVCMTADRVKTASGMQEALCICCTTTVSQSQGIIKGRLYWYQPS